MKIKNLFEDTEFTLEEFHQAFRLITEKNIKDALIVGFCLEDVEGIYSTSYLGWLVDLRGVEGCGNNKKEQRDILGETIFNALERLQSEKSTAMDELDVENAIVLFVCGNPLQVWPYCIINYMEPGGEGSTQVSDEDWNLWKSKGLVKD